MPRFGKDKDARKDELDRQAAEEVERLTRRAGPPGAGGGMGGGGYGGGPQIGMPSPLEMMAAEMEDDPRPVRRGAQPPPRKASPRQQQAFTPMPSGEVGSSFGPGGLNPGPRGAGGAAPPPAFGGGEDYGGHVTGPSVYYNNPTDFDEDEEISITELALMDHAAHTGHRPEDLAMQYDASSAEEMRDIAMRQFYERQQARRPGAGTNNPFAPAGMRRGPAGSGGPVRRDDPAAAGGALAQRLANKRRREEEEARRAAAEAAPPPASVAGPAPRPRAEAAVDEGALARVLARRRQALGVDSVAAPEPEPEPSVAPGRRHAGARATGSPGLRSVPTPDLGDDEDDSAPSLEDMAASTPTRRSAPAARKTTAPAAKAPAPKKTAKAPAAKPTPAARKAAAKAPPAKKTPAAKAGPAPRAAPAAKAKAANAGATLAKGPASKAKSPARTTGKAKTVFCMECGEKNPAIAKFCFNCGNRLAVPEG